LVSLGLWDYKVLEKVYEYNVLKNEEPTLYRLVEDFGRKVKPVVNALKKLEMYGLLSSRLEMIGRRRKRFIRLTKYGLLIYLYRKFKEEEESDPRLIYIAISIMGLAYFALWLDFYISALSEITPEQREELLQRSLKGFQTVFHTTFEELGTWLKGYLSILKKHAERLSVLAALSKYLNQTLQMCEYTAESTTLLLSTFVDTSVQQNPEKASKLRTLIEETKNFFKTDCSRILKVSSETSSAPKEGSQTS